MSFSPIKLAAAFEPPPWLKMDAAAFHAALAATPDRFPAAGPPPIRATRKAADWTAATYRAYDNVSRRMRSPLDQAKLDELLEQTLADGPDFAKVRRNAVFAQVAVVAYSRETAAEIMRQAREIERASYANRDKGKHGGALGRMALQLLEWFVFSLWPRARHGMSPSLAHIAEGARMSRASVVEALKRLERFGFLTIQRRRRQVPGLLGVKVVQDTNAYTLSLAQGLGALALAALAKPLAVAVKSAAGSKSSRSPAIRNEGYIPMRWGQEGYPKPDYKPLLE